MKKIIELDKKTIENIAAGEIINRPGSVVKELVENSIDAGATDIVVEIINGGKDYIRVTDNGEGIDKDDMDDVFKKHYTSKLTKFEDIFDISTRGFRGEALNSIENVSQTILTTRTEFDKVGRYIKYEFGSYVEKGESVANKGTTVEVFNLFQNMPVRRNFLASDKTEENNVISLMETFAVGYKGIAFRLISNKKTVLNTSGSNFLKNAILEVYDLALASNLIEINNTLNDYKLYGYIGNISNYSISNNKQKIYVNDRISDIKELDNQIQSMYYNLIPKSRKPVYFLFLETPGSAIDINVHPSKKYVRFNDFEFVKNFVRNEVGERLKENKNFNIVEKDDSISFLEESSNNEKDDEDNLYNVKRIEQSKDIKDISNYYEVSDNDLDYYIENEVSINTDYQIEIPEFFIKEESKITTQKNNIDEIFSKGTFWKENKSLGILFNKYYILENKDKMLIVVDIKRLYERYLYNLLSYKKEIESTQILLEPFIFKFDKYIIEKFEKNIELFRELNFDCTIFGEDTIIVRGIPTFLSDKFSENLFNDIMYDVLSDKSSEDLKFESLVRSISIIASNATTIYDEFTIKNILNDLFGSKNMMRSPNGMPIFTFISEKKFEELINWESLLL